ncbi:hypothetical protein [Sphaerisporangium dianthi]|uniref:Uncharacterized protein n=1 Tax=Sphaerisporangium dianthi TaxID=1436120 RepID=A0ABV9CH35_9ACTN
MTGRPPGNPGAAPVNQETHVGWQGDGVLVQDARRPVARRLRRTLSVSGLPAVAGLPSDRRIAAGIDTRGFSTYPLLFYGAFPEVSLAQLRALCTCGSLLFDHVLCLDELCDRPSPDDSGTVLLSTALYREALGMLHELFPARSRFWTHFDRNYQHFSQATLAEGARHRGLVTPFSRDELEMIYAGKSAVARSCLAALAVLDGNEQVIEPLESSHDLFYIGFQLADDLADWRADYERGMYTYPLTLAFLSAGWRDRVESSARPDPDEVGDLLVRSGAAEQTRALALRYLARAEAAASGFEVDGWSGAIRNTLRRVGALRPGGPPTGEDDGDPMTEPAAEPTTEPVSAGEVLMRWSGGRAADAPISRSWYAWLAPAREPRVPDEGILRTQAGILAEGRGVHSMGEALYDVGRAVHASLRAFPERGLEAHLGVSAGELSWLRRHDAWLDGMLTAGLGEPPELWSAAGPGAGWAPPAVGRYLGYRLIADCSGEPAAAALPSMDAVFRRHRDRSAG